MPASKFPLGHASLFGHVGRSFRQNWAWACQLTQWTVVPMCEMFLLKFKFKPYYLSIFVVYGHIIAVSLCCFFCFSNVDYCAEYSFCWSVFSILFLWESEEREVTWVASCYRFDSYEEGSEQLSNGCSLFQFTPFFPFAEKRNLSELKTNENERRYKPGRVRRRSILKQYESQTFAGNSIKNFRCHQCW